MKKKRAGLTLPEIVVYLAILGAIIALEIELRCLGQ